MAHHSENAKQVEALGELIKRGTAKTDTPLSEAQAQAAAVVVASTFDLAGKGTLVAFKKWILMVEAAGPYKDVGGDDTQAQNCAAEVCC